MIKTLDDTDFDEKLDFGEGGKLDKPVLDEPITVHYMSQGSNPGCSGGRHG